MEARAAEVLIAILGQPSTTPDPSRDNRENQHIQHHFERNLGINIGAFGHGPGRDSGCELGACEQNDVVNGVLVIDRIEKVEVEASPNHATNRIHRDSVAHCPDAKRADHVLY